MDTTFEIPLSKPCLGQEEINALLATAQSPWLTGGAETKAFETAFATYHGMPHAVALNSCTAALHLALATLPKAGEVILPSFTFVATANAVMHAGCTPVFVDCDEVTYAIDPLETRRAITKATVAIIPVHFAGHPCAMDELSGIAQEFGLSLIEDCAQACGARYRTRAVGSFGTSCFSFFPTKNMTTGEGGMLLTRDPSVAIRARRLAAHGVLKGETGDSRPFYRNVEEPGFNFRLTELQAAVGRVQLAKLDEMNNRRRIAAAWYTTRLRDISDLVLPQEAEGTHHVYQMYTVRIPHDPQRRDAIVNKLRARSIEASVHFRPAVHQMTYYRDRVGAMSLPRTERIADSIISLPLYPDITENQVEQVCSALCRELV